MTARLLDGKKIAEELRANIKDDVAQFVAKHGRQPGLDVVLVGDDPVFQQKCFA